MPATSAAPEPAAPTRYFPALTGVRGVACYLVLLFHFNPLLDTRHPLLAVRWLNYFIQQLHIALPVFFVLSGFVITYRYQTSVELRKPWLKTYFWNRFTRIYPIYFLLTAAAFLALQYFPNGTIAHWQAPTIGWKDKALALLLNLTMTKAFFKAFLLSGLPPAWSLTVEETFYLLSPLLLLSLRGRGRWRLLLLYPVLLLGAGALLVAVSNRLPVYLYGFLDSLNFMLRFTFFGRCAEFMCGAGLALYLAGRPAAAAGSAGRGWFTPGGGAGIIGCVVLLAIIKVQHVPTAAWPTSPWSIPVQNAVLPVFIALFFYGLIREDSGLRRMLSSAACELLGRSSYALYLIHLGVFNELFELYVSPNLLWKYLVYTLVAVLLYKYIEEPAQHYLRGRFRRPAAPELD